MTGLPLGELCRYSPAVVVRTLAIILSLMLLAGTSSWADHSSRIASLIDRSKLSTLGQRAANPRVQKAVYWLAMARAEGQQPAEVLDRAVAQAGYKALAAALTRDALLRNLDIANKLGCLDAAGLSEMRHGKAPSVMRETVRAVGETQQQAALSCKRQLPI